MVGALEPLSVQQVGCMTSAERTRAAGDLRQSPRKAEKVVRDDLRPVTPVSRE